MPAVSSFQKILLLSFFVLLFFPGGYLVANRFRFGQWGIDLGLTGAAERQELPAFTVAAWWSGHFQRDFLEWFGTYFCQKPRLVKYYNDFLYAAFRVSHMNGDTLRLGLRDWIFEDLYLRDFFNGEPPALASALTERADAIARLHRACEQKGFFLLVISPNKAAFDPEEALLWFQRKGAKVERGVGRFFVCSRKERFPSSTPTPGSWKKEKRVSPGLSFREEARAGTSGRPAWCSRISSSRRMIFFNGPWPGWLQAISAWILHLRKPIPISHAC